MSLPPEVRALLQDKVFAHLALVDEDGVPTVTPVWVDVDEDDRVVVNTAEGRVKARLLQVGARVAISALDALTGYRYAAVVGTVVERTHDGALEQIDALCRKYHDGRGWVARPGEQRVTVRIRADRASLHG